jgi:hypothetical protein
VSHYPISYVPLPWKIATSISVEVGLSFENNSLSQSRELIGRIFIIIPLAKRQVLRDNEEGKGLRMRSAESPQTGQPARGD